MPAAEPDRPRLPPPLGPVRAAGWRVEVVEQSPSTNADVAERARAGEPPGLVIVAEHQTAGRGRLDRTWTTPPRAALTFSLLVDPAPVPPGRWPWLPLLTGLAVTTAVRRGAGVDAVLKWPNDVLVDGRKVAGILVELVDRPGQGPVAVVGTGLNVSTSRSELPVETATSLAIEGAEPVDRSALLADLLGAFTALFDPWRAAAGRGLLPAYRQACSTLGRAVRVQLPNGEPLEGRAVDVDEEGRLLVDDGRRVHLLGAGDVVHVRPG